MNAEECREGKELEVKSWRNYLQTWPSYISDFPLDDVHAQLTQSSSDKDLKIRMILELLPK